MVQIIEKIVSLKPNLIVAVQGIYSKANITKLRSLHLNVLVMNPTSMETVLRAIILTGTVRA